MPRRKSKTLDRTKGDEGPQESFCDFFYGDLSHFKPNSHKIKSVDEEVAPKQKRRKKRKIRARMVGDLVLRQHEDAAVDLDFLSQDQPVGEILEPFEAISTISYSIKCKGGREESPKKLPRPPTVITRTCQIIIDRRPLLKKMQRNQEIPLNDELSSTSLIGLGEDCDESDNEIPEIDCDT